MSRKYTDAEIIDKVRDAGGTVIGKFSYSSVQQKIKVKCSNGHTIEQRVRVILNLGKIPCRECSNQVSYNENQIAKICKNANLKLLGYDLSSYGNISKTSKLTIRCREHGHEFNRTLGQLLKHTICTVCNSAEFKLEQFRNRLLSYGASKIKLGFTESGHLRYKAICSEGHDVQGYSNLIKDKDYLPCNTCYHNSTSVDRAIELTRIMSKTGIKVISDGYVNQDSPISVIYKCGHSSITSRKSIISGRSRCNICYPKRSSRGEGIVRDILKKIVNNNSIQEQTNYSWLINPKTKYQLRLDFTFTKWNIDFAIEYQGIQHYEEVSFGSSEQSRYSTLSMVRYKDALKRRLCAKNNIVLIAIPYYIDDIESYVKKRMLKKREELYERQ